MFVGTPCSNFYVYLGLPVSQFVLCDPADRLTGPGEIVNTGLEVYTVTGKHGRAGSA